MGGGTWTLLVVAMALVPAGGASPSVAVSAATASSAASVLAPQPALRERLIRDMKARSARDLSVLRLVRLWCHRRDEVSVVRVTGIIIRATEDRERWLPGPECRVQQRQQQPGGASSSEQQLAPTLL